MLLADARKLDIADMKEKMLRDRLEELYPNNSYFALASYPRYFLPGDEIKAGFYGLEVFTQRYTNLAIERSDSLV